jgi:hypothetical protein
LPRISRMSRAAMYSSVTEPIHRNNTMSG